VVLKWFYSLSRRKTFVGGKCALPSALLVVVVVDDDDDDDDNNDDYDVA